MGTAPPRGRPDPVVKGDLVYIADDLEELTFEGDLAWEIDAYEDIHEGFDWWLGKTEEFRQWLRSQGQAE